MKLDWKLGWPTVGGDITEPKWPRCVNLMILSIVSSNEKSLSVCHTYSNFSDVIVLIWYLTHYFFLHSQVNSIKTSITFQIRQFHITKFVFYSFVRFQIWKRNAQLKKGSKFMSLNRVIWWENLENTKLKRLSMSALLTRRRSSLWSGKASMSKFCTRILKSLLYCRTENSWEPLVNLNCPRILREFFIQRSLNEEFNVDVPVRSHLKESSYLSNQPMSQTARAYD